MGEYEDQLKAMVEDAYKCTAKHIETVRVTEAYKNGRVWDEAVAVFEIEGNSLAKRCYAWQFVTSVEKDHKRGKAYTVLHHGHVDSPMRAVQTVIAKEFQEQKK